MGEGVLQQQCGGKGASGRGGNVAIVRGIINIL